MEQWEYWVQLLVGSSRGVLKPQAQEHLFNQLGVDRWELVALIGASDDERGPTAYFKKRKPSKGTGA